MHLRGGFLGHVTRRGAQRRGRLPDHALDVGHRRRAAVVVAAVGEILEIDLDRVRGQRQALHLHIGEVQRALQPRHVLDGRHLFAQLLHAGVVGDARRHVVARSVAHVLVELGNPCLELGDVHPQADQFVDRHAQPAPHGNERVHALEGGIGLGLQAGDLFESAEQIGVDDVSQHQRGMVERNG